LPTDLLPFFLVLFGFGFGFGFWSSVSVLVFGLGFGFGFGSRFWFFFLLCCSFSFPARRCAVAGLGSPFLPMPMAFWLSLFCRLHFFGFTWGNGVRMFENNVCLLNPRNLLREEGFSSERALSFSRSCSVRTKALLLNDWCRLSMAFLRGDVHTTNL
jgi:hypothetical protein